LNGWLIGGHPVNLVVRRSSQVRDDGNGIRLDRHILMILAEPDYVACRNKTLP
jgi:hypothetical protein